MIELLLGKRKLKHNENTTLAEECNTIIQRNITPKFIDPSRFIIPCSIGSITIGHTLYDLEASISMMSLSMMTKLNYGKTKQAQMTLTLEDRYTT